MNVSPRFATNGLLALAVFAWSPAQPTPAPFYLTDPLSTMTSSDAFRKWVAKLDWSTLPVVRNRSCEGTPECDAGIDLTAVSIQPVGDAKGLKVSQLATIGKGYGVVVGRLQQDKKFGTRKEKKYQMDANTQDYYYMVVLPPVGSQPAQWVLVRDKGSAYTIVQGNEFRDCHDSPNNPPTTSQASFDNCQQGNHTAVSLAIANLQAAKAKKGVSATQLASGVKAAEAALRAVLGLTDPDSPAWFSCYYGCCTAQ